MKHKNIFRILAIVALILPVTACSKDDDTDDNNAPAVEQKNTATGTTQDGVLKAELINGLSTGNYTITYHDGIYYHVQDTTYFYLQAAMNFDRQASVVDLPYIQVLMRYDRDGFGIENAYYYEMGSRVDAIEQQYGTRMGDWRYFALDVSKSELRTVSTANGTVSATLCLDMASTYDILIDGKTNGDFRQAELILTLDNYTFRLDDLE